MQWGYIREKIPWTGSVTIFTLDKHNYMLYAWYYVIKNLNSLRTSLGFSEKIKSSADNEQKLSFYFFISPSPMYKWRI